MPHIMYNIKIKLDTNDGQAAHDMLEWKIPFTLRADGMTSSPRRAAKGTNATWAQRAQISGRKNNYSREKRIKIKILNLLCSADPAATRHQPRKFVLAISQCARNQRTRRFLPFLSGRGFQKKRQLS